LTSLTRPVRFLTFALATACLCGATVTQMPTESSQSWADTLWDLPVVRFFAQIFEPAPVELPSASASATVAELPKPVSVCSVAPLDPVEDPAAQQLEARVGTENVVNTEDMVPAAAQALDRFEQKVTSVGGSIVLKSAYRPAAYQQHLQNVWYKWMTQLRGNNEPGCQDLRAQVQNEFMGHHLIETQHPVAVSDHTRGLAFDATVELPRLAKRGRRITLDGLARVSGLLRPAIAADPVHFKFVGAAVRPASRRHRNA
jgi:D-alanyl-D-alanine dipeptidase